MREVVLGAKAPAPAEAEKLQAITRALVEAGFASPARAAGGPGEQALPEERLKELCKGCAPVSIPMNYRKKIFNALERMGGREGGAVPSPADAAAQRGPAAAGGEAAATPNEAEPAASSRPKSALPAGSGRTSGSGSRSPLDPGARERARERGRDRDRHRDRDRERDRERDRDRGRTSRTSGSASPLDARAQATPPGDKTALVSFARARPEAWKDWIASYRGSLLKAHMQRFVEQGQSLEKIFAFSEEILQEFRDEWGSKQGSDRTRDRERGRDRDRDRAGGRSPQGPLAAAEEEGRVLHVEGLEDMPQAAESESAVQKHFEAFGGITTQLSSLMPPTVAVVYEQAVSARMVVFLEQQMPMAVSGRAVTVSTARPGSLDAAILGKLRELIKSGTDGGVPGSLRPGAGVAALYEQLPDAKKRIAALGGLKSFCERCGLAFSGDAGQGHITDPGAAAKRRRVE